ncbi:hypothetical protein T484DRAFT_1757015 [Baffinella frigidus]|nr:hypothetical protein T484DRAFT_1757015 [Cryptophyta sp. CCMP2293]
MDMEILDERYTIENIFNEKERASYDRMMANSRNETLSVKKRKGSRSNAAKKLKIAMSRGRKEEYLTAYDLSDSNLEIVFNEKQRASYEKMMVKSRDETLSMKKRTDNRSRAAANLKDAVLKRKSMDGDQHATREWDKRMKLKNGSRNTEFAALKEKAEAGDTASILELDKKRKSSNDSGKKARTILKEKVAAGDIIAIAKNDRNRDMHRDCNATYRVNLEAKWVEENAARFSSSDSFGYTEFGLGDTSYTDDVKAKVETILDSPAGSILEDGSETTKKFIEEHGSITVRELIWRRDIVVYIYYTTQKIRCGYEIKCSETRAFAAHVHRDPMCRIDELDENGLRDLQRFTWCETTHFFFHIFWQNSRAVLMLRTLKGVYSSV